MTKKMMIIILPLVLMNKYILATTSSYPPGRHEINASTVHSIACTGRKRIDDAAEEETR